MNNLIIIGILVMVLGNGLGMYLIHLGRTEINKGSTKEVKEKIEEIGNDSEKRDSTTQTLIVESKEEIKEHYNTINTGTSNEIGLMNAKLDELLENNRYRNSNSDIIKKSYEYFLQKDISNADALLSEEFLKSTQVELESAFQLKGDLSFINSDIGKGIKYYVKLCELNPNKTHLRQLTDVYYRLNRMKDANENCDRELDLVAKNTNDYNPEEIANLYNKSFVINQQLGSNKKSIIKLEEGISLIEKKANLSNDDITILASLKANFGTYLSQNNQEDKGELLLKEVDLNINKILDTENDKHLLILGNTYFNLSNINSRKKNYKNAWEYLQKGENILQRKSIEYAVDNFYDLLIKITNNKATVNLELKNHPQAIECYQKTIDMAKAGKKGNLPRKYEELEAQGYLGVGNVYYHLKDTKNVEKYYTLSLDKFKMLDEEEPGRFKEKIEFLISELKKNER